MSDPEGCHVGQDMGEMMIGEGREKWIRLKFLSWLDGVCSKHVRHKAGVGGVLEAKKRWQSVV